MREFFKEHPRELYYERQLCVFFEKRYFHWITARALKQLTMEGKIASELKEMPDLRDEDGAAMALRFYRHPGHRYWQRQATEIAGLVRRFSVHLGHALGDYGEVLCDAGICGAGFMRAAKNAREWGDRRWTETEHNLDRIYVKDSIAYGCEVKNTLKYFPVVEREIKQRMCKHLGLVPLFVVRWLPKSHIFATIEAGGYAILFEEQLYPVGQEALAEEVRERLGLPVRCLTELPDTVVQRFVRLHEKRVQALLDGA